MTPLHTNPRLLSALEKVMSAQKAGADRMQQVQSQRQEDGLLSRLIQALEVMGNVTGFTGPKGDTGRQGIPGYTPVKGIDYRDGVDGRDGKNGESIVGPAGRDGRDGKDGQDASVAEMSGIAAAEVKTHEKHFDHTLIHDPKVLGTLELDESTIAEGKIFQVQGGKIVCIDLPQPQTVQPYYTASQGVSNVRSFTVTASRELEAMGIYVIDASAGDITITVPTAAGRENYWFELIRIDSSSNTVTVTPTGSETLSGMTDYLLTSQWSTLTLFAYNGNYLIRNV